MSAISKENPSKGLVNGRLLPRLMGLTLLLGLFGLGACATDDGAQENYTATEDALTGGSGMATEAKTSDAFSAEAGTSSSLMRGDSYDKTERRLQLERSLDQWWIAFRKQEYGKSDGLATALEQFVTKHYDEVVSDLTTSSPRFRKVAAAGLGFSGRKEAVQPLLGALNDSYADVVLSALLSLRTLAISGISVPATPVVGLLSQSDPDIRTNASMVLAHSVQNGQGELYLPLTSAMEDKEPAVRLHVAAALGRLGDGGAIPFLAKGLKDEFALVRVRSALAMSRIGDKRAVPYLIEAIDDPQKDVSQAAHRSLQELTDRKDVDRDRGSWEAYWKAQDQDTIKKS